MARPQDMMDEHDIEQRRRAARRTAWKLAIIALVIFGVFFMTGITGR